MWRRTVRNAKKWQVLTLALAASTLALACVGTLTADGGSSDLTNVQVLTHVTSKSEMRAVMKVQAGSLGVKCTHCHVPGKFALDDKKEKLRAREMLKMTAELNAKWFPDEEEPRVTCWTCHRGGTEPENTLPEGAGSADTTYEAAE